MALLKINGRLQFYTRVTEVRALRPGRYAVNSTIGGFFVEGGRPAGGTSRDWFVETADGSMIWGGTALRATSLLDALKLIDNT